MVANAESVAAIVLHPILLHSGPVARLPGLRRELTRTARIARKS